MPPLLRDNAGDARVAEDIASLAAAYDDDAVAASLAALETARTDDLGLLAAAYADDVPSGELPARRVLTAVARYRLYVAAAAVFLAILLFVNPVPLPLADGDVGDTFAIPTADRKEDPSSPPVESPIVNSSDIAAFDFGGVPGIDDFAPSTPVVVTEPERPAAPATLRITQSGYDATFSSTPAQQEPPENGLPAETVAGAVTQYSFVRLAGAARTLKLKLVTADGASLNAAEASIQLCEITTKGWKPSRADGSTASPVYNDNCFGGAKASNGIWSFAFPDIYNPLAEDGWAIVPVTTGNKTFRLTFSPNAA